jgi:LPXTG-motif cell wall-anchored protein
MSLRIKLAALAAAGMAATFGFAAVAVGVAQAAPSASITVSPNPIPLTESSSGPCTAAGGSSVPSAPCGAATDGGEVITVTVAANTVLGAGQSIDIGECQAAVLNTGAQVFGATANCDELTFSSNDFNGNPIVSGADGSLTVQIPINTLPTDSSGFDPHSTILVNGTNPLVLYVGDAATIGQSNFLLSNTVPLANPGAQTPEAPFAILLPLGAVALLGGGFLISRRRRNNAPTSA